MLGFCVSIRATVTSTGKIRYGVQQFVTSLTATGTHTSYVITWCNLPPDRGDIPGLTPAEAGTRFAMLTGELTRLNTDLLASEN